MFSKRQGASTGTAYRRNLYTQSFILFPSFFFCLTILQLIGCRHASDEVMQRILETTDNALENGLNRLDSEMYVVTGNTKENSPVTIFDNQITDMKDMHPVCTQKLYQL